MLSALITGIESWPHNGKSNHDTAMDELSYAFEKRIRAKADVEKDNLEPGKP